jgi:hypothetical protein
VRPQIGARSPFASVTGITGRPTLPRIDDIVVFSLALVLRVDKGDARRLSLALARCGEFGLVLFGAAQAGGLFIAERTRWRAP